MELSVSTESELGLGRARLLHLIEVAEQPRMGRGKSARGTHHVRQNILYAPRTICVASEGLLFVGIFSELDMYMLTELCPLPFKTFPACLADMTSRARPPSDWNRHNRFSTQSLVVLEADRLFFNYYHLPRDFASQTLQSCQAHNLLYYCMNRWKSTKKLSF